MKEESHDETSANNGQDCKYTGGQRDSSSALDMSVLKRTV